MHLTASQAGRHRRALASARNKKAYDPTKVRMSKYFMLSDFMGNHSVYTRGLSNQINTNDDAKIARGYMLADTLDALEEALGIISVSYGFISPSLSQMIVGYQDPNKPSFHRWELGAACDIQFMEHDYSNNGKPSIHMAGEILKTLDGMDFARMITYAESPCICFATSDQPRENTRRIYEYRHVAGSKPLYAKWTGNEQALITSLDDRSHPVYSTNGGDWEGEGYPTQHSYKIRQLHHSRIAETVNLSDLLYSRDAVHYGRINTPKETHSVTQNIYRAASILDGVQQHVGHRVSVVSAYENPDTHPRTERSYEHGFNLDIVMPEGVYTDSEALDLVRTAIAASPSSYADAVLAGNSSLEIQRIQIRG